MHGVDLEVFFDPVCPFCWVTSRWIEQVRGPRELTVRWRPISLWLLNREGADPDRPLSRMHQQGLALLRVVVEVERELGHEPIGRLYTAFGEAIWDAPSPGDGSFDAVARDVAAGRDVEACLAAAGLPARFAAAHDAQAPGTAERDALIDASTNEALARVGGGVGTPVLSFAPPDGPAFFGPVLSEVPDTERALALWDAVATLAFTPSFAELKRSQRSLPALRLLGGTPA